VTYARLLWEDLNLLSNKDNIDWLFTNNSSSNPYIVMGTSNIPSGLFEKIAGSGPNIKMGSVQEVNAIDF